MAVIMAYYSKFYATSSSSSSDSEIVPESKAQAKKTIGFYVLQARSSMHTRDYAKILKAVLMISQKCQAKSGVSTELRVACLRLCRQVERYIEDEQYPHDRHVRRRVLSAGQAKAALSLQQKHVEIVSNIRSRLSCSVPEEMYSESAKSMLDNLERHLISNPLRPIPLEMLNTFELVNEDHHIGASHCLTTSGYRDF